MHPSQAERVYLDQLARQREQSAAAAQQSQLSAALAQRQSAAAAFNDVHIGAAMKYVEESSDRPDIEIGSGADATATVLLPGEFGTAMSLVLTLQAFKGRYDPQDGSYLWCLPATTVDSENWITLGSPGESSYRILSANAGAVSWRLHGPFGNTLALRCQARDSNRADARFNMAGLWTHVKVSIGVQRP